MRISDWSSDVCSSDLLHRCAGVHEFALAVDVAPAFLARPLEPDQGSVADEGERVGSRLHGVKIRSSPARRPPLIAWPFASGTRCARPQAPPAGSTEEQLVGKEGGSPCRSRG